MHWAGRHPLGQRPHLLTICRGWDLMKRLHLVAIPGLSSPPCAATLEHPHPLGIIRN